MIWAAIITLALVNAYAIWNISIAFDTIDRNQRYATSLNESRVKHERAILKLQECFNQKADTCTVEAKDFWIRE